MARVDERGEWHGENHRCGGLNNPASGRAGLMSKIPDCRVSARAGNKPCCSSLIMVACMIIRDVVFAKGGSRISQAACGLQCFWKKGVESGSPHDNAGKSSVPAISPVLSHGLRRTYPSCKAGGSRQKQATPPCPYSPRACLRYCPGVSPDNCRNQRMNDWLPPNCRRIATDSTASGLFARYRRAISSRTSSYNCR